MEVISRGVTGVGGALIYIPSRADANQSSSVSMSRLLFSVLVLCVLVASTATAPLPDSGKNDMCWYIILCSKIAAQ